MRRFYAILPGDAATVALRARVTRYTLRHAAHARRFRFFAEMLPIFSAAAARR